MAFAHASKLQVLNQYDPCCFAGLLGLTYRDVLKDVVGRLRGGRYEFFIDSSHREHRISGHALTQAVLPFLRRRDLQPDDDLDLE